MSRELPRPTPAETEILNVLWDLGPSTVRQVHDRLSTERAPGYTTVLKTMQIMADKGLIARENGEARAHVFSAVLHREAAQRQMVREVIDRFFGGNPAQMVLQALEETPASQSEIDEIRQMIERRAAGGNS